MIDVDSIKLPVPGIDEMPPMVMATSDDIAAAESERAARRVLLNPKLDTEKAVKYVLQSRLFGGRFRKDGDWVTLAGGKQVWQKKVADLFGGLPIQASPYLITTYVEVKGVSPGNRFAFSRLDKRNNPSQPSQHEKLCAAMMRDQLILLAIGWWDPLPGAAPVIIEKRGRKYTKWNRSDVELTIYLFNWTDWLDIYRSSKRRSIGKRERAAISDYAIFKRRGRWVFARNHWWPRFSGATAATGGA